MNGGKNLCSAVFEPRMLCPACCMLAFFHLFSLHLFGINCAQKEIDQRAYTAHATVGIPRLPLTRGRYIFNASNFLPKCCKFRFVFSINLLLRISIAKTHTQNEQHFHWFETKKQNISKHITHCHFTYHVRVCWFTFVSISSSSHLKPNDPKCWFLVCHSMQVFRLIVLTSYCAARTETIACLAVCADVTTTLSLQMQINFPRQTTSRRTSVKQLCKMCNFDRHERGRVSVVVHIFCLRHLMRIDRPDLKSQHTKQLELIDSLCVWSARSVMSLFLRFHFVAYFAFMCEASDSNDKQTSVANSSYKYSIWMKEEKK